MRPARLVQRWGKTTVVAADTPGFIVNRIARPFYGEALRILDEGIADCATIDWAMRTLGGFRMGPFELMDLIGNDVNFAVTSVGLRGVLLRSALQALAHAATPGRCQSARPEDRPGLLRLPRRARPRRHRRRTRPSGDRSWSGSWRC